MDMSTGHRRISLCLLIVPFVLLALGAGAGPLAAQGTFARTGDMTVGRNWSTATLLNDGRVLVAGGTRTGDSGSVFNQSAEIYDLNTGAFTATGSMSVPRFAAAASRLSDGRVLVLGGLNGDTISDAADVFDPNTGAFKATGSLLRPRYQTIAAFLKDGRVLVAGGYSYNNNLAEIIVGTSEIYDPKIGTFAQSGDLGARREEHATVTLPDGRVLVLGGFSTTGDSFFPKQVELFDPASGTFSTIGQLNEGRYDTSATLLSDGKVLVAGGIALTPDGQSSIVSNTVEVFDPATGKSTTVGTMSEGRARHVAVALTDGRVLVAGGIAGAGTGDHSTASADLFDPKTGKITPAAPLTEARAQFPAVRLLDGRVLIVGGARYTNGAVSGRLQTAELYTP